MKVRRFKRFRLQIYKSLRQQYYRIYSQLLKNGREKVVEVYSLNCYTLQSIFANGRHVVWIKVGEGEEEGVKTLVSSFGREETTKCYFSLSKMVCELL